MFNNWFDTLDAIDEDSKKRKKYFSNLEKEINIMKKENELLEKSIVDLKEFLNQDNIRE